MTKPISASAPSLLDAVASPAQEAPSLLSSLGNTTPRQTGKKQGRPVFWFIAIPLLLIGLVVAAAMVIANNVTASFTPANPSAPTKPANMPKPAVHAEAKSPVAPVEAAPVQVATIINDLPAEPQKKPEHPATLPASNPHDRLSAALTSTADAPSKPAPVVANTQAHAQTVVAAHTPPQQATGKIKSASAPAQTDVDDRDVKLLTALVASTKETPPKKTSTEKTSHPKTEKATADSKNNSSKDDSRNQDVVERKPGDRTADLLKRCKKLGIIEGELCRWRICSERWDTDLACKANAQPKSPAADNTPQ